MNRSASATQELAIQRQVGARIRELRIAGGVTTQELASQAGISQGQLSKIENGKATISIKNLTRLCAVLNRPLSYLFQREEEIPKVLGTLTTVEGPENQGIQWFARQVHQRTGGRISMIPLTPSQLGTAHDQVSQVADGVIDLFVEALYHYQKFVPGFNIFSLPYVFRSNQQQESFLQSDYFVGKLQRPLQKHKIGFLNKRWNWLRGLERVLVSDRPIVDPDDIRGLRVRVFDCDLLVRFWEAMGAIPVVVHWSEVGKALRTRAVDVVATHKTHVYPLGFCRYARYVTLIGDISPALGVGVNQSKFQVLPPDLQTTLQETCDAAGDYFTRRIQEAEQENQALNTRDHKAAYMQVDIAAWENAAGRAVRRLLRDGLIERDLWQTIQEID